MAALASVLPLRPINQKQLVATLIGRTRQGIRKSVHQLDTQTFRISAENADFCRIFGTADLLYADGMTIVRAVRCHGRSIPERLSAADYFEAFFRQCAQSGITL